MTQNNEREAFEKVFKLPIYLAWDDKFEGYIPKNKNDESSKLAAYAYDNRFQGWLARAKSQNEQQEAVAYIYRNEYNEYRLEPADNFNIKTIPMNEHILLYKSPPKQAIPEDVIKDAERYNWLKQNYHGFEMFRHSTIPYVTLDREVDKAMLNSAPTNTEVGE